MTVEQNVLQHHSQKYQQVLLNQLRDATGTTDTQRLQHALQACNGDLTKAVALLVANNSRVPKQNESTYFLTAQMDAGSHTDSSDDKDELQKALELSLTGSSDVFRETGVSEEEQAISRVLEASIEANKRSQSTPWSELPNPHDRKRQDSCPVGLKNVGNTCWFSAVIQSLFHLLEFQRLVLLYAPLERSGDLPRNQQESHSVLFVRELRRLFALMLASKRKYVDPSRALEIFNTAFKSSGAQQQDVSEFTHKLLDWLEDAFQIQEEQEGEKLRNPLVELFYGKFLALGVLEGKRFENTEMFGQYPLQVNGFKDLHECLEAATTEGEIETLHSGNSGKSEQERWFTELPPVLTFELSRFQFNQAMGRPEKIHSKLEFPSVLYMDRYMHRNREVTQLKRAEMRKLREHLTFLQQQLERYLSYGSGPKRLPLAHVLQYAMEFASAKSGLPPSSEEEDDPRAADPPGGSTPPPQPTPSAPPPDTPPLTPPAPRHITPEEMQVLEDCLRRWRSEVEADIQELQGRVASTHGTMERVTSDTAMMQVPYRLHAVLVHEGQACTGHYWAYIYSAQQRCWMRYNDIAVTAASWEELAQESYGGHRNASAYCLMYASTASPCRSQDEVDEETGQTSDVLDRLPPDLRAYVTEDNQLYEKELEEWDATRSQQASQGSSQPRSTEPSSAQSTVPQEAADSVDASPTAGALVAWREDVERVLSQTAREDPERTPEALLSAPDYEGPAIQLTSQDHVKTDALSSPPITAQPMGMSLPASQPMDDIPLPPAAEPISSMSQPLISQSMGNLSLSADEVFPPLSHKPIGNMSPPFPAQLEVEFSPPPPTQLVVDLSPPPLAQPMVELSQPTRQLVMDSSPPPPGQLVVELFLTPLVKPMVELSPPPPAQPMVELSPPPPAQPMVELSPPPPAQPMVELSLPPPAQPMVKLSPPPPAQPMVELSPPPPALPMVELSLPPPAQPMVELSPPPPAQPMVELSPPPPALPMVELSPPPPAQPMVKLSLPPPAQPMVKLSPPCRAQLVVKLSPPPPAQLVVELSPFPPAQPMGGNDGNVKVQDCDSESL